MVAQLFGRNVAMTFGSKKSGEAKKITGLRTVFQIEKDSESFPNSAKITVYNMSEESRALARSADAFVMLEAGYGDRLEILYLGDVVRAYISKPGADWITTVECGDGMNAVRRVHIDKSYAPGTSYETIIKDVVKSFVDKGKVAMGSLMGIKSKQAVGGEVLSEMSKDALDRLCRDQGLEWSIQNNTIQVLPRDKDIGKEAVLLSADTGLIGVPVLREVNNKAGVEFKALIQPGLEPGRLVQIDMEIMREANGLYKLEAVDFVGDTHGQAWYAEGTAVSI